MRRMATMRIAERRHNPKMITCPWCGTDYTSFQPTCRQCGGTLPLAPESAPGTEGSTLRVPPSPPRQVPRNYIGRILSTNAIAIVAGILILLGAIFLPVGLGLILPIAAVGVPFAILGLAFLGVGVPLMVWRYRQAKEMAEVLRTGLSVLGEIVSVSQNYAIQVNGRFPWSIVYRFRVAGREFEGKVSTLSAPTLGQQAGRPVYVLYDRDDPARNTIYPHPYGYYGV
jgi:hypothetical protein